MDKFIPELAPGRGREDYCSRVDILIMCLLLAVAVMLWRGAKREMTIALWVVGLILMVGLFRWHVTSTLDLSF